MRFFGIAAAVFVCCAGVYLAGAMLQLGAPTESSRWTWDNVSYKRGLAEGQPSPRILIVSGSNALFGVSAERLQKEFGIPSINLAVYAGLHVDYLSYLITRIARPKDIVIAPFEYHLYRADHADNEWLVDYVVARDPGYLDTLPLYSRWRFLFSMPIERWLRGLLGVFAEPRRTVNFYPVAKLNRNGDQTLNDEATWSEAEREAIAARRASIEPEVSIGALHPDRSELDKVRRLADWAKQSGVRFFIAWPTILNAPQYGEGVNTVMFREIATYLDEHGIDVLGTYRDEFADIGSIYDSENHLTAAAAQRRSDRLVKALRAQHVGPMARDLAGGLVRQD